MNLPPKITDITAVGYQEPWDLCCVTTVGYFRGCEGVDDIDDIDLFSVAASLLLEQFKRPIREGEV